MKNKQHQVYQNHKIREQKETPWNSKQLELVMVEKNISLLAESFAFEQFVWYFSQYSISEQL